ncbi:ABC transporter substrate-binding protein [Mesorhizobium shangrilense]|uniref:ABC transporter substrate-binding protein n=1 Tax=Mesorhizobium shangrilense TaxID=460060 RepID=A0ABV2DEJ6_9HYPH
MSGFSGRRMRRIIAAALVGGITLAAGIGAAAAENAKLRFAYLLADSDLPILVAQKNGDFAKAGLDVELTEVQGGPAVVAAIASGSADVGYSSPVPPINARLNGINVKMVMALGHEVDPDSKFSWLVASGASEVTSLAGLKGKKVAINANGSLCVLTWSDHMAKAGVTMGDVETVVLPFPQQEAALEQGAIDATCTVNPFYASIVKNQAIGAKILATGVLADEKIPVLNDVIFASDDYVANNADALKAFGKVIFDTRQTLLADRGAMEAAASEFLGLTPEAAKDFNLPVVKRELTISEAEVQVLLDAMKRAGMTTQDIPVKDMVANMAP